MSTTRGTAITTENTNMNKNENKNGNKNENKKGNENRTATSRSEDAEKTTALRGFPRQADRRSTPDAPGSATAAPRQPPHQPPHQPSRQPSDPASDPAPAHAPDHRLRWPEALAIALALLLGGAVAAGAFRPMLPWLG